jgi:hypothetical protein
MRRVLALLVVCAAACSSGPSSPGGAGDAGAEAAPGQDASSDACFPFCSSSSGGSSGSGSGADAEVDAQSCEGLRATVESLLPAARACNPALAGQCTGTTDGICCAVSVSAGNESAANDLAVAVAAYKQSCTPSCVGIVCQPAPSNTCVPLQGGQSGLCQ